MFEKLLELFFHAKAGAFAGLILIGTTGALVTATVSSSNGVTTITLTQASASPSGSASPSHSPSASPTRSPSPSPTTSPTTSPSSSPASAATVACTNDTHAMSDAVKTVNAAFSMYHTDLVHMRNNFKSDAAKKIVEDTDKLLKSLRQNAVKDIHATSACAKAEDDDEDADENDGEDNDNDEDKDEDGDNEKSSKKHSDVNFIVVLFNNLFGNNTTTTTTSNTTTMTTLTTAGDPKTIADTAVAAMKLVFDDAVAKLQALPSPSPRATKSPKPTAHADRSGKGNGSHEREDDEDDD